MLFAELTPVLSVLVDYTCTNNSVRVTWSLVSGAKSYMATAVDERGRQMTCTSQGTSCQITGLNCGQHYVVNVTPVSDSCKNLVNATSASFQTGETQIILILILHLKVFLHKILKVHVTGRDFLQQKKKLLNSPTI